MALWQQDEPPATPGGVTRSTFVEHGSPHAALEHERAVTEALGEIARELAVGVDRDTVLRGIAERVRRLCPADLVVLAVSDERPHDARVVARAGPEGAAHDSAVFHASDPGPAGQALTTGIPVVADCQPDPCRRHARRSPSVRSPARNGTAATARIASAPTASSGRRQGSG